MVHFASAIYTGQVFIAKVAAEVPVAVGDKVTPSCRAEDMIHLES